MLYVIKRDGRKEEIQFDKITERISRLIHYDEQKFLMSVLVAQKVIASVYSGITTEELDIESAEICVNLSTLHPSYSLLGGRILISNLHKKTLNSFVDKMNLLPNMNSDFLYFINNNKEEIDNIIDYSRDYVYDYFGFKTLERSYLLKLNDQIIERPQDMLLRCAITLQINNIDLIKKTYDYMSKGFYTHASPTLFNAGMKHQQMSSCFLLQTHDSLEEISKTWNSCAQISKWAGGIGLGVSNIRANNSIIKGTGGKSNGLVPFLRIFNDIARWIDQGGRRPGSMAIYLETHHPDILEFLDLRKNFGAETERARDLFYALWISDLFMEQVEADGDWYLLSPDECPGLEKVYGKEYKELYYDYVIAGKYRKKVSARKLWHNILETQIETGMPYINFKDSVNRKSNHKNIGVIRSSNLCSEIVQYSDHNEYAVCNLASISLKHFIEKYNFNTNDKWIIYSKEGCKYCKLAKSYLNNNNVTFEEIDYNNNSYNDIKKLIREQYKDNRPVTYPQILCNDKLIGGYDELYNFTAAKFDYEKLYEVAYLATINLNNVIDLNYYPVPETRISNAKHRPIGLGVQGLADALSLMRIPFDSEEAITFNKKYMETIYLASLTASNDIAKLRYEDMRKLKDIKLDYPQYYDKNFEVNFDLYHKMKPNIYEIQNNKYGYYGAYSSFSGSPFSKGILQFDMWNYDDLIYKDEWNKLKENIKIYGTRNSLITALMPTASTSQILNNNECFEYFTNNIYTRKTNAGDFVMVNKYLVNDLINLNLWNKDLKDKIIANNGSVQNLDIPDKIKEMYKTIWEIKQIWVLKQAVARGPFVDQTQSMNIFMAEPDFQRLNSSHFWAWKNGLKTGMYYLRTKPSSNPIKFTIDPNLEKGCSNCSA